MLAEPDDPGWLAAPPARARLLAAAIGCGVWTIAATAAAHPDDYIDETFVYQTVEPGELELDLWSDVRGGNGRDTSALYTGAVEVGVTERWMVDSALQVRHDGNGVRVERLRAETRLRFADEGGVAGRRSGVRGVRARA